MNTYQILTGDVIEQLRTIPAGSIHTCVTSPPYWNLRDYGVSGQIGLEATPQEYVARLVEVFEEVRRVLRDDGTLWLNLGDSYNGSGGAGGDYNAGGLKDGQPRYPGRKVGGLKPKDLVGIPWRVAFALQDAGWWLRAEIIWAKRAPMPESVTDRPTRSHEQIFLLTKSARYFYDAEAVRETMVKGAAGSTFVDGKTGVNGQGRQSQAERTDNGAGRNQRDVWLLGPEPYPEAHFATFPTEIPRRAIRAGTSERGCCPACGAPWKRVVEKPDMAGRPRRSANSKMMAIDNKFAGANSAGQQYQEWRSANQNVTTGWLPTCTCGAPNDWQADDLEVIATPTGERAGDDPSLHTGRGGYNRPRGDNEGQRPITRYEQRQYAAQLRNSPHRASMEAATGSAFDHYIRTDRSGARPLPDDLLGAWLDCGWLTRAAVPAWQPLPPVPCTVLDPFAGSGTTVAVAIEQGRDGIGVELNPEYVELARRRIGAVAPLLAKEL